MLSQQAAHSKYLRTGRVTMGHRHFATIADILRDIPDAGYRADMADHFADALAATNPRFDRERFIKACGC
jgi:hypothetical protein